MFNITDKHIEYIENDIKSRGIEFEELRENIIDHICCIIENEKPNDINFHSFYENNIKRFFNQDLKEIQQETETLIRSKSIDYMLQALKLSGILSVILLLLGIYFKFYHIKGVGIIFFSAISIFTLVFIPLLIRLKFKDHSSIKNIGFVSIGFITVLTASIGCLFKIMQWPYATVIQLTGTLIFLILFIPLYYFINIKSIEKKFITFINTIIMLVIGILFFLLCA